MYLKNYYIQNMYEYISTKGEKCKIQKERQKCCIKNAL